MGAVTVKVTIAVGCPAIPKIYMAVCSCIEQSRPIVNWVVEFVATRVMLPTQCFIVVNIHLNSSLNPWAFYPLTPHLYEPLHALYEVFGYGLAMPHLQHILIAVLGLYCCFMVFKLSANSGFFLLPLLLVLPPLVFKSRKKESGEEETIWLLASCLSTSHQS